MNIQLDLLAGIAYGYLFFYKLRQYIQFSDNFVLKCENSIVFKYLTTMTGFISLQVAGVSSGFTVFRGQQNTNTNTSQQNNNSGFIVEDPSRKAPVTTPFKGKGTVVG